MKNNVVRDLLYVVLFMALFLVIQTVVDLGGAAVYAIGTGKEVTSVYTDMAAGKYSQLLTSLMVLSSLITIALFTATKWVSVSRTYLKSKPWFVLFWVVFLALGTILPLEWIYEKIQLAMPEQTEQLFEGMMKEPWGYAAIGLVVPIAEEIVFRGGILRKLLGMFNQRLHWVAIILSALIFGAMHGNLAQGIHAFIIGLLLGWMFYRTRSIIPGLALHWVNNTVAYVMYNIMPQMNDGKLIDLFHGNDKMMYLGLACSLCIVIPSLLQLAVRMKPGKE